MDDIVKPTVEPFDFTEDFRALRDRYREIGAMEFKLKVVKYLQEHGHDARTVRAVLDVPIKD